MNPITYLVCALCVVIALVGMGLLYVQSQSVADVTANTVREAMQPDLGQSQRAVSVCVAGLLNIGSCTTEQANAATTDEPKVGMGLDLVLLLLTIVCITAPCAVFLSWLLGGSEVRI